MGKKTIQTGDASGFYKGYDIKWLRNNPDHSDFHLVAEFDALDAPAEVVEE